MQAEFVVPAELGRAERDAFADELFAVHESIFAGVERRAFRAYVVEPDADWTWVLVHRDGGGRLVGYFAGHAYTREVFGRTATVLRGEAGFVRAMRGGNALLRVGFVEAARTMLKSRGRPVYYLGCLVHPVSYYNLAKYMQPVWPSHGTEPTGERLAQLSALGDSFGLRPVGADPLVRHVGWQTRQTEAEAAFWARCPKPSVQYFVQRNPGYGEGHGLLTLTPVSAASLGGAGARMVQLHGRRAAQRLSTRLSQAPLLRGWLGTAEVRRRLRAVPLFQTLDAPALDALARAARQRELPNGHTLVHQGSTGDTLYVVLEGAVHILRSPAGGEAEPTLVEQLDAGDVLGEVAALTGAPRNATARTATRARVLEVPGDALRAAMGAGRALHAEIWLRVAERQPGGADLDDAMALDPLLARLPEPVRDDLPERATRLGLAPGEPVITQGEPADAFYVVASGEVEVQVDGEPVARLGPGRTFGERGLMAGGAGVRAATVVAVVPSALLRLPAADFHAQVAPFLALSGPEGSEGVDPLTALVAEAWAADPPQPVQRVHVAVGETLLRAGDPPREAFRLLEGEVEVRRLGEAPVTLGPGHCVGERGVLFEAPRSATVTARTALTVERCEAGALRAWLAGQAGLGAVVASVGEGAGAARTQVRRGRLGGRTAITAYSPLEDGGALTLTRHEGHPLLVMRRTLGPDATSRGQPIERLRFERAPAGSRALIGRRGRQLVAVELEGDLSEGPALSARLRSGAPLTRGELERFRWTGRLGPPGHDGARLVCPCVGVLRVDLDGVADEAEAVARLGVGSVCGGCAPVLGRHFQRRAAAPAGGGPAAGEIGFDAFEARLDGLRHVDPAQPLFPPESVVWRVFGHNASLLGGLRGFLLQFAHPAVAAALAAHGGFLDAPGERFHATLRQMFGMAFGDGDTMVGLARRVFEVHAGVRGVHGAEAGAGLAGTPWAANQVDLLVWVAVTVTESAVLAYEACVATLSPAERDALVQDAAFLFGLFGIPQAALPADWGALQAFVQAMIAGDTLRVGEPARRLAQVVMHPEHLEGELAFKLLRRLAAHWLPPRLREAYGLSESRAQRAATVATLAALKAAVPRLPDAVQTSAARLDAERRLRGEPAQAGSGEGLVERLLARALGVELAP